MVVLSQVWMESPYGFLPTRLEVYDMEIWDVSVTEEMKRVAPRASDRYQRRGGGACWMTFGRRGRGCCRNSEMSSAKLVWRLRYGFA
jgi:hypothetical protein